MFYRYVQLPRAGIEAPFANMINGLAPLTIIEAPSAAYADSRAGSAGIRVGANSFYFSGQPVWARVGRGSKEPKIDPTTLTYVHYADGRVEAHYPAKTTTLAFVK